MKLVLRISRGITLWDISRGLRNWRPYFKYLPLEQKAYLLFHSGIVSSAQKTNEVEAESIILLIFVLRRCFNCWWLRGSRVGQKIFVRVSRNRIFCLLLWLKSQYTRGASRHLTFMVVVLIKEMRRAGQVFFC